MFFIKLLKSPKPFTTSISHSPGILNLLHQIYFLLLMPSTLLYSLFPWSHRQVQKYCRYHNEYHNFQDFLNFALMLLADSGNWFILSNFFLLFPISLLLPLFPFPLFFLLLHSFSLHLRSFNPLLSLLKQPLDLLFHPLLLGVEVL
jgi:hypothetical protein